MTATLVPPKTTDAPADTQEEVPTLPQEPLPIPPFEIVQDSKIRTAVVRFEPKHGAALITHMQHQRNLSQGFVNRYVRDILSDNWALTGESMILSGVEQDEIRDGHLYLKDMHGGWVGIEAEDLQHRAHAVVEAGKPIEVLLVWGIDPAVRDRINQSKARSLVDVLNYADDLGIERGSINLTHLKDAAVKQMTVEAIWRGEKAYTPTSSEMLRWLEDNMEMIESVELAEAWRDKLPVKAAPQIVAMVGFHLRHVYDRDTEEQFLESFATMAGLPADHPYLVLRRVLDRWAGAVKRNDGRKVTWRDYYRSIFNAARIAQTPDRWPVREMTIREKPDRGSLPRPMKPLRSADDAE